MSSKGESRPAPRRWTWICLVAVGGLLILGGSAGLFATMVKQGRCSPETPRRFGLTYSISSGSMMPTLEPGDVILVDPGYFCRHDPARGDLAVFAPPSDSKTFYVKRIVGLPGDRVRLVGGQLYINDAPTPREWAESATGSNAAGASHQQTEFIESPPDGHPYHVLISNGKAAAENTGVVVVPRDGYFVLGDNRDNSLDSRMRDKFGFIPRAAMADRPALIVWSGNSARIGRPLE